MLLELVDDLLHALHIAIVLVIESGVGLEPFSVELLLGFLSGQMSDFAPLCLDLLDLCVIRASEKSSRSSWSSDRSCNIVVVNGIRERLEEKDISDDDCDTVTTWNSFASSCTLFLLVETYRKRWLQQREWKSK